MAKGRLIFRSLIILGLLFITGVNIYQNYVIGTQRSLILRMMTDPCPGRSEEKI